MRTIKFRGKRATDGQWIYGYYLVNRGEHFVVPEEVADPFAAYEDYLVDPETIGQFTGLHDSEGREIWEGDIIEVTETTLEREPRKVTGVVVYEESMAEYVIQTKYRMAGSSLGLNGLEHSIRIIGNIHDNPELLQDKLDKI